MHALLWNMSIHQQPTKFSECNPHIGSSLSQILCPSHTSMCNLFPMYISHHSTLARMVMSSNNMITSCPSCYTGIVTFDYEVYHNRRGSSNKSFQGNPFAKEVVVMVETNGWLTWNFILSKDGDKSSNSEMESRSIHSVSNCNVRGWQKRVSNQPWSVNSLDPYNFCVGTVNLALTLVLWSSVFGDLWIRWFWSEDYFILWASINFPCM